MPMKKPTFKIVIVDDYHEFDDVPKGHKVIELGCFPTEHKSYTMYFGVQYTGRKPSLDRVWKKVKSLVCFKTIGTRLAEYQFTEELVLEEVKAALNFKGR